MSGWHFTMHALARGVEMALDADEIRQALTSPARLADAGHGLTWRKRGRVAVLCDERDRAVVTIAWSKEDGDPRYSRDDLSLCRDPG